MSREPSLDQPLDLTTVYGVYWSAVEIWRLLGLGNGNVCTDMDATSIASFIRGNPSSCSLFTARLYSRTAAISPRYR